MVLYHRRHYTINMFVTGLLLLVAAAAAAPQAATENRTFISRRREQFQVVFEWKTVNFTWPSSEEYSKAKETSKYIPQNVIISGMKHFGNKLYLSLPRLKPGVPTTLAWIPAEPVENNTSPLLTPFPDWELNVLGDCRGFQSVQGFEIDASGRMWVLDNGRVSYANKSESKVSCPPSLSIIDLTDGINAIVRYPLPEAVAPPGSYLNDLVVDNTDGDYAYITDSGAVDPGIVVFSKKESRSWKFRDNASMRGTAEASKFKVGNEEFNLTVNVDGIALGPRYVNKKNAVDRNVYFCPLSSFELFGTPSSVLRREAFSEQSADLRSKLVVNLGRKTSQTDGMIMDEEGYMFYGLLGNHTIAHWDHKSNFNTNQETISRDNKYIQWVDRFAFDEAGSLFAIINRMQNYIVDKVNVDQPNQRILKSRTGTKSYLYSPTLVPVSDGKVKTIVINKNSGVSITANWLTILTTIYIIISSR